VAHEWWAKERKMKNMDGESGVVKAEGTYTCFLNLTSLNTRFGYFNVFVMPEDNLSFLNIIYNYCIMSGHNMMLTFHLHQVLRLKMSGAIPVIRLYAFVACTWATLPFAFIKNI